MTGRVLIVRALVTALAALAVVALGASSATARPLPPPCDDPPPPVFEDAGRYRVHSSAIGCIAGLGVTDGVSATHYGYDDPLSLGQLATFLARSMDTVGDRVLLPQPIGSWYPGATPHAAAIDRLHEVGIIPDLEVVDASARVRRGHMAELLATTLRYAEVLVDGAATVDFEDVAAQPEAPSIRALGGAGIVAGDGEGRFRPDEPLTRAQMATFVVNLLAFIDNGGAPLPPPAPPPTPPPPPPPPPVRAPEGWVIAPGTGDVVGTAGTIMRYTVEIADGLQERMALEEFAARVEDTLSDAQRGWTSRGRHRLQRVDDPARARFRVLLATPARVDRLCGLVGLRTAGVYSCWNGRFTALNSDRWFGGVGHIADLEVYRTYLVNHEVGHALGYGHVGCPGTGRLAPVMVQQSMPNRLGGCVANGWPYP